MGGWGARIAALACALLLTDGVAVAATDHGFDSPASTDPSQQFAVDNPQRHNTPNDPGYDSAEPDDEDSGTASSVYEEDFGLFGFASRLTRSSATYHDDGHGHASGDPQVSGFNASGAWKLERGRPDVSVAILDTGIRWDRCGLRDKIRLNRVELPLPRDGAGQTHPAAALGGYDLNGNGAIDVDDYADDSRVGRAFSGSCGGAVTGYDLIQAFSNHDDADHNGFVDDIAGWNFFDDSNDPTDRSSYFAAENHGSGRAGEAVEQGNDGQGSLGVCPKCQFVPIRVWDTFVADGNNFGMGMLYASDNGINVVEGADGSLYHSAFAEAASQHAYERGASQVYSGDDLNTSNHNYPANYNHTMLIQGTVPDTVGLGQNFADSSPLRNPVCTAQPLLCFGTQLPPGTYFRGAGTTQFGGHSSIAMEGSTGSENTGKASGAAALVISAAKDAGVADPSPDEVRETLEQTAEDVTAANTGGVGVADPAQAGWDEHFGWGRADLGTAVALAHTGKLPPEASIDSPDWFAPLTGDHAALRGRLRARFATGGQFHYKVQWGVGPAPTAWNDVAGGEGDSSGTVTDLGTLDLAAIRSALASRVVSQDPGGPVFSPTSRNPYQDQFAVRVVVDATANGVPTKGVDRKVLVAVPDGQNLKPGFPKRMGTGGEAPLRYADLNGDNVQELIVPTEDGTIHAYEPNGSELSGWPVHTQVQYSAADHLGAPAFAADGVAAPREPPRGPTVADLDGDGVPELITAAGLRIYVFEPDGSQRPGFPVRNDPSFCRPQDERQENSDGGAFHRKCGFLATPAVGHLENGTQLDIVAPSLDGHLYALRPDGSPVPHYPVDLVDPQKGPNERVYAEAINSPAIRDLDGDGKDDIVVPTNEAYGGSPNPTGDLSFVGLLGAAAGQSTRVYAISGAKGTLIQGWPISISGLIQNTLPLIGPGHDPAVATIQGETRVVASATSGDLREYQDNGHGSTTMQQGGSLNLFESASIGDVLGTGSLDVVKYQIDAAQAGNLLLTGQNVPYSHRIGAFDATTGASLPGYPTITDDYQFLSASTIAKVDGQATPTNQIVAGTGLGLLHAYDGLTGQDVAGFPKVTGGWLFAPAALSDDGRMAGITREGYLFEWGSQAAACQSQWPSFRHDPHGSGNYNHDGTAPGAPTNLKFEGGKLTFTAPGDDGPKCGTPARYQVVQSDTPLTPQSLGGAEALTPPTPLAAGSKQSIVLPTPGRRYVAVRAIDDGVTSGAPDPTRQNIGPMAEFDLVGNTAVGPGSGDHPTGPGTGAPGSPSVGGSGSGGGSGTARCLSAARVGSSSIGPIRLGDSRATVLRRAGRPTRTPRNALVYCLRGGGTLRAELLGGRVRLVLQNAARRGARGIVPGVARRALVRGVRGLHHVPGILGLYRAGRTVFVLGRTGRVRYVGVANAGLAANDRALTSAVKRTGA